MKIYLTVYTERYKARVVAEWRHGRKGAHTERLETRGAILAHTLNQAKHDVLALLVGQRPYEIPDQIEFVRRPQPKCPACGRMGRAHAD